LNSDEINIVYDHCLFKKKEANSVEGTSFYFISGILHELILNIEYKVVR